jgi:hypothetical protein
MKPSMSTYATSPTPPLNYVAALDVDIAQPRQKAKEQVHSLVSMSRNSIVRSDPARNFGSHHWNDGQRAQETSVSCTTAMISIPPRSCPSSS